MEEVQLQQAEVGDVPAAAEAIQTQDEIPAGRPTQPVTNWIWLIVVGTFSLVLVGATGGLIWAVFVGPEDIQLLLTVVTTVAGILAGVISARGSTTR
jgi:hypothetical protein